MSIKAEAECNSCGVTVPVEQAVHWIMINPLSSMGEPIGKPMHLCREKCTPEFAAKYPGAELAAFLVTTAPRVEVITREARIDISSDGPVSPRLARTTVMFKPTFEWFRTRQIIIPGGTADAPLEKVRHPVTGLPVTVRIGAESAKDWIVSDFRIGNRSEFAQAGEIAGDVLREMDAMDFAICQLGMTMSIDVRYVGKNPDGEVFTATLVGVVPDPATANGDAKVESSTSTTVGDTSKEVVMVDASERRTKRHDRGPMLDVQQPFNALPAPVREIAQNLSMWFAKFDNDPNRITQRSPAQMLIGGAELEVVHVGADDVITHIIDATKNGNVVHAGGPGRVYNIVSLVLAHTRKLAPSDQPPRYVVRVVDPAAAFLPNKKRDEAKLVFEMPAALRGVAAHTPDVTATATPTT